MLVLVVKAALVQGSRLVLDSTLLCLETPAADRDVSQAFVHRVVNGADEIIAGLVRAECKKSLRSQILSSQ